MSAASLKPSDYVHLHNHTHHSLLDGLTKVNELVDHVKELGMEAVAVTDHGTMSGAIEFYKLAKDAGIKPIIGMETYVAARTYQDRDAQLDKARYHLILLAMNHKGYQNLMRLSTIANLEGYYYKPRIDHNLLEQYNEGLIALSACMGGEVSENLDQDNYEKARDIAKWYQSIFGDRYYLELQDHGHPDAPSPWDRQIKVNKGLFKISEELGIKTVVTCDAHYLKHEDQDPHEILLCVQTGSFMSDTKRMSLKEFELHVTDPQELIGRWGKDHPECISNTKEIADRCNIEIELGKILIPTFPTPEGHNEKTYLDLLVYRGLAWRYAGVPKAEADEMTVEAAQKVIPEDVAERTAYELSVIEKMGFNGYFLIIWDFICWGKNQGIIFGPGRGSAAGSIIAYALNITELDPLKYDLLFERFLNPDRISMPDVDIDIQDTRRDEVIAYCTEKYGKDRVANIVTFGRMAAKAAIRDVARVLQVPYSDADRLSKLVPAPVQGRMAPLKKSIVDDPDLKKEYESNPTAKQVIDLAIRLENTIRSHGIHAAGVVIAPDEIVKFAPLEMAQKGVVSTQYPMGPVEELGLLKMDFLGLSNLSIINNAQRIIKKVYKTDIDLQTIPLDDEKTYKLFQAGDTTGVFQLESAGMKRYLRELKPTKFDDIIAMVALYRPGPMQFIDSFIRRKHGEEEITYLHPKMEGALGSTYGILVYQEQFMQISKDVSGFTGGQADTLRKAVGKKKIDLMRKVKPEFIEGGVKNSGADPKLMEKFWDQLEEFANYCFNKSHAACYGLVAYWTAYLKAHFPDAFMAALMTSDADDIERLAIEIGECLKMGIKVFPPDVNESFVDFSVVKDQNQIRFGMAAVKGVGTGAVETILAAREEGGNFKSVEDFAKRVATTKVNRKAWEALVKAGGFDKLGDRSDLLFNLDTLLAYASKLQKEAKSGQTDLFGDLREELAPAPQVKLEPAPTRHSEKERLMWERELLGLYLSSHPLDPYDDYFSEQTVGLHQIKPEINNRNVTVGGVITTTRTIITKSNTKMAFVGLEDKTGEGEIIVFPNLFEKVGEILVQDAVVKVQGKVNATDRDGNPVNEAKIIADDIILITDEELNNYRATGKKMKTPKAASKVAAIGAKKSATAAGPTGPKVIYKPIEDDDYRPPVQVKPPKLYVHVKNPQDHKALVQLKQTFNEFPGSHEVILVLGADKSSAVRMPFKVVADDEVLKGKVAALLGAECVAVK
ncbi:DNA polymerase III subunit alpha [Candidatus Saccharibacteria bacterium]|nr:DNA polymerase III subunit alpha [Candidatus Saccharibacteria bacterium]